MVTPGPRPWPAAGDSVECDGVVYGVVGATIYRLELHPLAGPWHTNRIAYADPESLELVGSAGGPWAPPVNRWRGPIEPPLAVRRGGPTGRVQSQIGSVVL